MKNKNWILINGVDVSGCEFFQENPLYEIKHACNARGYSKEDGQHTHLSCKDNPNCYYKLLQLEKEKNAALNDSSRHAMRALNTYGDLNKKYYNALKQIHDETKENNIKEIARIAIYTGGKENIQQNAFNKIQNMDKDALAAFFDEYLCCDFCYDVLDKKQNTLCEDFCNSRKQAIIKWLEQEVKNVS